MLRFLSITTIILVAAGIALVAFMAFVNPQAVMDLVQVKLPNPDAYSSIRGVYGGAGLTLVVALLYLASTDLQKGLLLVAILCGFYALSRLITGQIEGPLGPFGSRWLLIEASMCSLALLLRWLRARSFAVRTANQLKSDTRPNPAG
ncbi:DUF4345 domain-containing protein [Fibrella forsythiae]|uniref:DUF4345 domain-containing protein n=1 Tax=Fibrella forsythiae TaxID=2817061 RepID=A0ABS3JSQ5_9BACT|nr:DUF4345 domain-containing protein [Fibrella forsythiae]MBO0953055.1 DUF4345 domain-containing protein [Fibrella forsythiae]